MDADAVGPEDFERVLEEAPVAVPAMRSADLAGAMAVEDGFGGRIHGDTQAVDGNVAIELQVGPREQGGVREHGDGHLGQFPVQALEDDARVLRHARVRDHGEAHALHGGDALARADGDLVERHHRPGHAYETLAFVTAFAVALQAAVGAVGGAPLVVGHQQVDAPQAGAAIEPTRRDAERHGGGQADAQILGTFQAGSL